MATILGTSGDDAALNGGADPDTIIAFGGEDEINGGGGNDIIIVGPGGDDTIDGGGGDGDMVVLSGAFTDYVVTYDAGAIVFTKDGVSERITGTEAVAFDDQVVRIVGAGSENSIQDAVDAANEGETILVTEGEHDGNATIDKDGITIAGVGDAANIVIKGDFKSDNGIPGGTTVSDWLETAPGYDGSAGSGLTVAADGVTIKGLTISEFTHGVKLDSNDDLTIEDVVFAENIIGIYKEDGAAEVTGFELIGGSITDGYQGIIINAASGVGGFDDVTIDGTTFTDLLHKGMYFEQLSNAELSNITMNDVGQFGTGQWQPAKGRDGSGIELNLKYDDFVNVLIDVFDLTNVGLSNGGGSPHFNGAAIAIKARGDAPTYSGDPATLDGVTISNGTIDGTSTGIRAGEPNKVNAEPSNVTITDVEITNAVTADVDNQTQETVTVNLADGGHTLIAREASTGDYVFNGGDGIDDVTSGGGDDSFKGAAGDDTFDGKAGVDTAVYDATLDGGDIGFDSVNERWEIATGGPAEGADRLKNVERIDHGGVSEDSDILLVGAGGYASIQAAINAADAGDTIVVAAGTYNENLSITKGLNFVASGGEVTVNSLAANTPVVSITGDHDGEATSFTGFNFTGATGMGLDQGVGVYVTATDASALTFDDVSVTGNGGYGIFTLNADIDQLNITNSDIASNATNGVNSGGYIKLFGFVGNALLQNLLIQGAPDGSPQAQRPDYGIEFHGIENAVLNGNPALLPPMGTVVIDNVDVTGEFHKRPFAINNYANLDGLSIVGLDLSTAESWWGPGNTESYLFGVDGVSDDIDMSTFDVLFNGAWPFAASLLGEHASQDPVNQAITGTDGADIILGQEGDDTMNGGDGNDLVTGGDGADAHNGGQGDDTASYATAATGAVINLTDPGSNSGAALGDTFSSIETFVLSGFNDHFTGNGAGEVVFAGAGVDFLFGGGGNDALSGEGDSDLISGEAGDDTLSGGASADALSGGDANDILIGGAGGDLHDGGTGSDTVSYETSSAAVVASLAAPGGNTGDAAGDTYVSIEGLRGTDLGDSLTGNGSANTLDGGEGDDTLTGGSGHDLYIVDSAGDVLTEGANQGSDTVQSSLDWTLATNFEHLVLMGAATIGAGNGSANGITGTGLANNLYGKGDNDTLNGEGGDDVLNGGLGADNLNGGGGTDTASYSLASSGVKASLADPGSNTGEAEGDAYASIEGLLGSKLGDSLTGDGSGNTLRGNDGNDTLNGGGGDDTLRGEGGTTTMSWTQAAIRFSSRRARAATRSRPRSTGRSGPTSSIWC